MSGLPTLGWQHGWQAPVALLAGFLAGVINAIAGGGSLLSFPTLVWLGLPPLLPNATNTAAVWPASLSSAWAFRGELVRQRRQWHWLIVPALGGGVLGAVILLRTGATRFEHMAPWLVLAATVLVGSEPLLRRALPASATGSGRLSGQQWAALLVMQFVIALYGGYFGIGIGLLMLAAYALAGLGDIKLEIAVKNACATLINGAAVIYFVVRGFVVWHAALTMAAGSVLGGLAGAALARRLRRPAVRWTVVGIGVAATVALLAR